VQHGWVLVFPLVLVLLLLRIRFTYVMALIILAGVLIYYNWTNIITPMKYKEKVVSSSKFENHIKSISNITTDVSNTERLNRWSCAIRMFEEKPVFGWGPGTYMFKYAPFQLFKDRTIISTNRGNLVMPIVNTWDHWQNPVSLDYSQS